MRNQSLRQIFTIPCVLAVLSAVGLTAALLGDDVWDAFSWLALAIPAVICFYFPIWRSLSKTAPARRSGQRSR